MGRALNVLVLGSAVAGASGCATATRLRAETDAMTRRSDQLASEGLRCAPAELANADADVAFVRLELKQGHVVRAAEHRSEAATHLGELQRAIDACPPPDTDGDGVGDPEDRCAETPGPEALAGCPDRDADGIPDIDDQCAGEPEDKDGFEDGDGCPDLDKDGDGIADEDDGCPLEPEDKDGFEDGDGCPDLDNDGDGIADEVDGCPMEAEIVNGYRDEDGCPDQKLTLVQLDRDKGKIDIKQKVFFRRGSARLSPRSFGLLGQVSQVLRENDDLRVRIEGHTDATGSNSTNLRLSQSRADAVRNYLVRLGVDPDRLVAVGYGEEQPIASNATRSGRERNRRVEFTILGAQPE
jgi:outer membrane protein OmpA-like peptidoglycan-associated protein